MARKLLVAEANVLLDKILSGFDSDVGFGSFTCSLYDTAWVACVSKTVDGKSTWLIPSSFQYVLDHQGSEGGWHVPGGSDSAHILTALSGLHALLVHLDKPTEDDQPRLADLQDRASKAATFINTKLQAWDMAHPAATHFEVLIPSLLLILQQYGYSFEFKAKDILLEKRDRKLANMDWRLLYEPHRVTLLHALEAFAAYPQFEFDRVPHHVRDGSIMGSPAATAAYLIYAKNWDDDVEAYLFNAFKFGSGKSSGGFPVSFPSTGFEVLWGLSTLLEAGLTKEEIGATRLVKLNGVIESSRDSDTGLFGFAPDIQPDCDDTAMASVVLSYIRGRSLSRQLQTSFEISTHFVTYPGERFSSFTANCNALHALALSKDPHSQDAVTKVVLFLLKKWTECECRLHDKWNLSDNYAFMLMAQAFTSVMEASEKGIFKLEEYLLQEMELALWQCMMRTLLTQYDNGSWGTVGPVIETSFAICTLASTSKLQQSVHIRHFVSDAIYRGLHFLETKPDFTPEPVWVEKTPYGSYVISHAFVLAAKLMVSHGFEPKKVLKSNVSVEPARLAKLSGFMQQLPIMRETPRWFATASYVEGKLWTPILRRAMPQIFDREGFVDDKYRVYIPFIWAAANYMCGACQAPWMLRDMMISSMLNYQAAEYMEAQHKAGNRNYANIAQAIESLFTHGPTSIKGSVQIVCGPNGCVPTPIIRSTASEIEAQYKEYLRPLEKLRDWVLGHTHTLASATHQQETLKNGLKNYLLAQVEQTRDNELFAASNGTALLNGESGGKSQAKQPTEKSFQNWLETTSSVHTSVPYVFELFCAFSSATRHGQEVFTNSEQKALATKFAQHLSIVCRLQSDAGAMQRDKETGQLNCVDFPEFAKFKGDEKKLKRKLIKLADDEKEDMNDVKDELFELVDVKTRMMVDVFRTVTEMFGEVYVAKDISSKRILGD